MNLWWICDLTFPSWWLSCARKNTHLEHQTYLHLGTRVSEDEISFEILRNLDQFSVLRSDRYWCQMSLNHISKVFHPYTVLHSIIFHDSCIKNRGKTMQNRFAKNGWNFRQILCVSCPWIFISCRRGITFGLTFRWRHHSVGPSAAEGWAVWDLPNWGPLLNININNHYWLVVFLEHDFHFSIDWEFRHPNWRTHIFQRVGTTNQTTVSNHWQP